MASQSILAMAWGEAINLAPKDTSANPEALARLHAVIAKLASIAENNGFAGQFRQIGAPRVGAPDAAAFETLKATADAVASGAWRGAPLPLRAVLWEISAGGTPRLDRPLPAGAAWVLDKGVATGGDFVVGDGADGRIFRLFESSLPPGPGEPLFVSPLTGAGLPPLPGKNPYIRVAWGLGIAATLLFLLGGALAAWSGSSAASARSALNNGAPERQYELLESIAAACVSDMRANPAGAHAELCGKLLKDNKLPERDKASGQLAWPDDAGAQTVLAAAGLCPAKADSAGCNTFWRAAVAADEGHSWKKSVFKYMHAAAGWLAGAGPADGSASILLPFLMLLAGIAGLIAALGLGTQRRVAGVWIDTRNRVSLARAQVTIWTAVALSGYAALAMFNAGFTAGANPADFVNFSVFPQFQPAIATALGIAGLSPMLSSLILPTKDKSEPELQLRDAAADLRNRGAPFFGAGSSGLDKRETPLKASITDIFMGEENANKDTVDVARLQNVVITGTLALGFFSVLAGMMSAIDAQTLLGAKGPLFTSLPAMGATFTSLLGVSHATYLVSKAADKSGPAMPAQ